MNFRIRQINTGIQKAAVRGMCQHDNSTFLALGFIFQKNQALKHWEATFLKQYQNF